MSERKKYDLRGVGLIVGLMWGAAGYFIAIEAAPLRVAYMITICAWFTLAFVSDLSEKK